MMELDPEKSNSIEQYRKGNKVLTRIKPFTAMAELYKDCLPQEKIADYLDNLENHVKIAALAKGISPPSSQAFSNTRGVWFESLVAIGAWNYRITKAPGYLILKLPNITSFNFREIFEPVTREMLQQLEKSLLDQLHEVRMITSNPDLLVIKQPDLIEEYFNTPITSILEQDVKKVTEGYRLIKQRCQWESLIAGIGLKTSLRPDRRLQLVHEGNILKSLFAHLKMRHWNKNPIFEYYGAANDKISKA